jgi:hypothetical protein
MKKYVYESPDGGKTIYRRNFGEYDLRTMIKETPNDQELGTKIRQWYFKTSKNEQSKN